MNHIISPRFFDYAETVRENKKSFLLVLFLLILIEWAAQSVAGLTIKDTPSDVAGAALLSSMMTYLKWIIVGGLCVNVVTTSLRKKIPDITIKRTSVLFALIKSLFLWFVLFLMLFSLLLAVGGAGLDLSSLNSPDGMGDNGGALIVILLTASALMFFSLVYTIPLFQQYLLNTLMKRKSGNRSKEHVNGFIVPFWGIAQLPKFWRAFLVSFGILLVVAVKGMLEGIGWGPLALVVSGVPGLAFAILVTSGVTRAVSVRFEGA